MRQQVGVPSDGNLELSFAIQRLWEYWSQKWRMWQLHLPIHTKSRDLTHGEPIHWIGTSDRSSSQFSGKDIAYILLLTWYWTRKQENMFCTACVFQPVFVAWMHILHGSPSPPFLPVLSRPFTVIRCLLLDTRVTRVCRAQRGITTIELIWDIDSEQSFSKNNETRIVCREENKSISSKPAELTCK